MQTFTIDSFSDITAGIAVQRNGSMFQIDFCGQYFKPINKLELSDLKDGRVMQLFADTNFSTRKLNLNRYFAKANPNGVILFLERLNFVRNQTLLGKRIWLESSKNKGGDCGLLVVNFHSTGVIAVQIDGEVFLFSKEHPGMACSVSENAFTKLQGKTSLEDDPKSALAKEVTWLVLQEKQSKETPIHPERTLGPILESALQKKKQV